MTEFLITGTLGIALIGACCFITYELLRFVWALLPKLTWPPRYRVAVVVAVVFAGHIANIWLFGMVYYALINIFEVGTLRGLEIASGEYVLDIFGCAYFSAVTYCTLGFGDITPTGALRMVASVEGLTGIMMIGWTVSFTYLAMEKFWTLPHARK